MHYGPKSVSMTKPVLCDHQFVLLTLKHKADIFSLTHYRNLLLKLIFVNSQVAGVSPIMKLVKHFELHLSVFINALSVQYLRLMLQSTRAQTAKRQWL